MAADKDKLAADQAKYNDLKAQNNFADDEDVAAAQAAVDEAQANLDAVSEKIAQWQQALVDKKDTATSYHLDNLKKSIKALTIRQGQAQDALKAAQENLANEQAKLAKFQAVQAKNQAALDSANEALTNAKNTLADTEKKNADFKDALANTQAIKDYEAASATLVEYQKELASVQETVAKVEAAFNEAQQKEDAAKETYLTDKAKLQDLEALAAKEDEYVVAFEQASDKLNEAQAALDEAQKALQDKNASLSVANGEVKYWEGVLVALESKPAISDEGTQTDKPGTNKPGEDAKGNEEPSKTANEDKVVVNDVKKVVTTSEKKVEVKAIAKKAEAPKADAKAATLPQMGEKDNNEAAVVGLGLAGVAGALGLGVLNKKRS